MAKSDKDTQSGNLNLRLPNKALEEVAKIQKKEGGTLSGVGREIFLHGLRTWKGVTLKDGQGQGGGTEEELIALRAQVEVLKSVIAGKVA